MLKVNGGVCTLVVSHTTMDRRNFIRQSSLTAAAISLSGADLFSAPKKNKLPQWKGFNLLDFFSPDPKNSRISTTEDHFRWMQDWGFNFVRLPMAYPYYLKFDRSRNITPDEVYSFDEEAIAKIDRVVEAALKYDMHVSLNLHRAPGYCVNAGFYEPYNLWTDKDALDAFCAHWSAATAVTRRWLRPLEIRAQPLSDRSGGPNSAARCGP